MSQTMTPSGRATFMPAQDTIDPSATMHPYPVVEQYRYIWVWTGDPSLADESLIPDLHMNDDPAWAGDGRTIKVNCSCQLIVDNLMDLTHEQFVLGSSTGHEGLSATDFETSHTGASRPTPATTSTSSRCGTPRWTTASPATCRRPAGSASPRWSARARR